MVVTREDGGGSWGGALGAAEVEAEEGIMGGRGHLGEEGRGEGGGE